MYTPDPARYAADQYRRAGRSGLRLPIVSLGLWHNFGGVDRLETMRAMLRTAFDGGITHFDLANNYGPPPGSAETNLGQLLREDFAGLRDELVLSTKAGYTMWPGPYGDWGSRKYLLSSLDASLRRLGVEYVDVFYHHRPDPHTPLEETMTALADAVRSGRALYVGLSNYPAGLTRRAAALLRDLGTPCVLHQPRYSLLDRWVERPDPQDEQGGTLLDVLRAGGIGAVAFSPLAQGLLTDRYLRGVPEDSRRAAQRVPSGERGHAGARGPGPPPRRAGRRARADARSARAGLGAAPPGSHVRADRGQPPRPDHRRPGGPARRPAERRGPRGGGRRLQRLTAGATP